uniref:Uncharacterized protein n=1 Tax=Medicago truncatula TaxID=3880 RepID=I3SZD0_MEDTR|nr:unknown [Medicago truncatula]
MTSRTKRQKRKWILTLSLLPQPSDCASHSYSTGSIQSVSTTSFHFSTIFAAPNTDSFPLDSILSTELAEEFTVLTDFHFLNLLPQTSTISGAVFANNTGLLGSLCHCSGD